MIIVPAILATTREELQQQWDRVTSLTNRIQIDIIDGVYVANKTVSIPEVLSLLRTASSTPQIDFHCMVTDWQKTLQELSSFPARSILFHQEIYTNSIPQKNIGIVLSPGISLLPHYDYSCIQVMTVTPGQQGNVFRPEQLGVLEKLRARGYIGELLIDGGVSDETLPIILKQHTKPNVLCVGSYFTHTISPAETWERYRSLTTLL